MPCRILGEHDSALQEFWPSKQQVFSFNFAASFSKEVAYDIRWAVQAAENRFDEIFGLKLAAPVQVVSGKTHSEMHALVRKHGNLRYERGAFQRFYARTCRPSVIISGFASPAYMAICLPVLEDDLSLGERLLLKHVALHEYVHAVQYQLAGLSPHGSQAQWAGHLGPLWMVEGVATYLAFYSAFIKIDPDLVKAAAKLLSLEPSAELGSFDDHAAREAAPQDLYEQGLLAVMELVRLSSDKALVQYYRDIGAGLSWKESFEKNFTMTPEAFYAHFAGS